MKNLKTRIAAAATVIGLGAIAGVALSSNQGKAPATAAQSPRPKVRTQVIRRTIHITRHAMPSPAAAVAGAPPAPAGVANVEPVASTTTPILTQSSGAPASTTGAPVHTSASGAGSGEAEHEQEHEGRDD